MDDKEIVIANAKKKFNGQLLDIVLNQIETYFKVLSSNTKIQTKYKVGDSVILTKDHLLHGIGTHLDVLETIAKRGIVSQDYYGDTSNHAFAYESAFWTVAKEITLKEYIINYSGMIAKYNDKYEQVPYGKLDEFVEKMKTIKHWLWTAESSMEIRFMPNLAKNTNQIGFILNLNDKDALSLRKNSIFKEPFNKEYALEFISANAKDKFIKNGFQEDFFNRTDYLIFGLPINYFEGIIVGRIIEHNKEYISQLKKLFPNCYICNLDGIIIHT